MKSKLTISIASILSVLVLVGVGFAAWVIINPKVGADADGNIEVDTVTDNSYDIKAEFVKTVDTTNGTIVFGKKDDPSITNPWLTNNEKAEKLTATLTLTAQNFKADSWTEISKKNFNRFYENYYKETGRKYGDRRYRICGFSDRKEIY